MEDSASEKDKEEKTEETQEAPPSEEKQETDAKVELVPEEEVEEEEEDDDEEETFSVEELDAEVSRLRIQVSKLKAVLWQLGYDSEGKRRI